MRHRLAITALSASVLLAVGCAQSDQGSTVSVEDQKKAEAATPQTIQNANIPPQAKAAAIKNWQNGQAMGRAQGH